MRFGPPCFVLFKIADPLLLLSRLPHLQWSPEISHFIPSVPVILVGTKIDLRTSVAEIGLMRAQGTTPITPEEGEAVAREIGARAYLECSSRTGQGVDEVFEEALKLCLKGRRMSARAAERRKRNCVVL